MWKVTWNKTRSNFKRFLVRWDQMAWYKPQKCTNFYSQHLILKSLNFYRMENLSLVMNRMAIRFKDWWRSITWRIMKERLNFICTGLSLGLIRLSILSDIGWRRINRFLCFIKVGIKYRNQCSKKSPNLQHKRIKQQK